MYSFQNQESLASSPDLNPLDFCIWSVIEDFVFQYNPQSIAQIKAKVQECIDELNEDEEKLRCIVENLRKRAQLWIEQEGGHFEFLM